MENNNKSDQNSDPLRKGKDETENRVKFNVITAAEANMGIGKNYVLPWHLPNEFEYFLTMTAKPRPDSRGNKRRNVIIIGRKTWETLDQLTFKPFPNSINIVMSQSKEHEKEISKYADTIKCASIHEAVQTIKGFQKEVDQVWVLGGADVYRLAIESPYFHRLYVTHIHNTYECDSYFPEEIKLNDFDVLDRDEIDDDRVPNGIQVDKSTGVKFEVKVYQKKSAETSIS